MRLELLATAAVLLTTGCGAMYEDVPVYGESDPNSFVQPRVQQGSVAAITADNRSVQAIDPGQEVNADAAQPPDTYTDTDPSALTDFKAALDPYGQWSDDGTYGTVWQPDPGVVGADFEPYVSAGHWGYDNNEYTWASDYDWGWAPFHYGRWAWIAGRGWCWIPGRTYSGGWVSWRVGAPGYGYVGWGPLAPTWGWRGGRAFGLGFTGHTPYSFCGTGDLFSSNLRSHIVRGGDVTVIGGNTRPWGSDGRTPAHPSVGSPPPSRFGLAPPPLVSTSTPGLARAQAYARPSTATSFGAHAPSYTRAQAPSRIEHATQVPYDHPIATSPRYVGVAPRSYSSYGTQRSYSMPQSYRSYGSYGGGGSYGRAYSPPASYRGGGFSGGGGGYHAPASSPSYSHSYSHSGGGGFHGGGFHGGGGGHGGGGHR